MIMFFRLALLLSVGVLLFLPSANGQSLKKALGDSQGQPIVIKSNSLEFDHQNKKVTFSGNVDAKREDWTIQCQNMVVHYVDSAKGSSEKESMKIDKIIAKGGVKIIRSSGGLATAEEATYYWDEERVVLTGKPVVQQGDDFVEGAVVTLLLKENRSLVEGSGDTRARAVIAPRSDKR
jgi:lipopolysaccharide export system protein LptA